MHLLLTLAFLANIALFAFGQGFFGTPPVEQGREPRPLSQRNQAAIVLSPPLTSDTTRP
ncbi:MAG TPA: hypothetical protein VL024_00485 [Castellaniella sp.]|nr:hypothetical protein [Castellaniella sp.]